MSLKEKNKAKEKGSPTREKKNTRKITRWLREKPIRWIAILVLLIVAGIYGINWIRSRDSANSNYQTYEVNRSNLVAIVGATGIVEANQTVDLSWETTGRVASIYKNVNDPVVEGDILAELEENTLPQNVILAQADLVAAKRELEELLNSKTETADAYLAYLKAEQDLNTAEDDRDQWNYKNANWERVNAARAEYIQADNLFIEAQDKFNACRDLSDDDLDKIAAKERLDETRLKRDKALRNLNYILGKAYSRQVAEDFADYDLALAKLQDARREWERVKDGPNADDIRAAKARVAAAEVTASLGWLEAPFFGTVTKAYPKVGDQVSPGTKGFRIDDLSALFVKVDISEVDINRVAVGQRADLFFDAVSGKTYSGEVTEVAKVGVDLGQGVEFEVKLKILDPDANVRPGMTAAVNIIVNEIKDVLVVPNRAIRMFEGKRYIHLLSEGELKEVEIGIGASSDTFSEIISGDIEIGSIVVLNPPVFLQSNSGPPAFVR